MAASDFDYKRFWSPAFDNMDEFVMLIDREFNVIMANEAYRNFEKGAIADLLKKKCHEVVHMLGEPLDGCPHKRSLETKKFQSGQLYDPKRKIWLYVRVTPIFDDGNNMVGTIHMAADITIIKGAEAELGKKIEMLEAFQKMAVDRELKMIDLKKEIEALKHKPGCG